jgi:hypothetical protein
MDGVSKIRRRKLQFGLRGLLLLMVVLGCIFAILELSWRRDPKAVAYLRIVPTVSPLGYVHTAQYQASLQSHQSAVKSPAVIDTVLANPKIAMLPVIARNGDAVRWLQQNVSVSHPVESDLIVLNLRCKPLGEAKQVLDAFVDAYLDSVKNKGSAKQVKSLGRSRIE